MSQSIIIGQQRNSNNFYLELPLNHLIAFLPSHVRKYLQPRLWNSFHFSGYAIFKTVLAIY